MLTKAEISFVRSLSDKRSRMESGCFVVEGRKLVEETVNSGLCVERLFVSAGEDMSFFRNAETVSRKDIDRMSALKTPQGVLAVVKIPVYEFPGYAGRELALALDCIQDPGNLGTIIRVADWFGVRDIICSRDTVDCFNPKVVQATMGAILRVRVHYRDLKSVLNESAENGIAVYGACLEGDNIYKADIPYPDSGIVVLGNEGRGVSDELSGFITRRIFIPPYPPDSSGSESLNVGTAAAVVVSEFRRRL